MGKSDKIVAIHLSEGRKDRDNVIVSLKRKLKRRGLNVEVVSFRSIGSIRPVATTVVIPRGGRMAGLSGVCKRVDKRLGEMEKLKIPTNTFRTGDAMVSS